ncbi:hypothetical protein QFC21_002070 [Naganishia friedmannii]|uniref:Uncharacterized protein n=1 Tax=Naganishia friedmannii TaxID=89922 RepID=A0ACC2VZ20_9TREE|nr:hypothetical protein QFC21_002070 [Naganishia friedmannii]
MRIPLFTTILSLVNLTLPALAIQKSLAGVVDWHTQLIGIPRHDLAPGFHRVPAVVNGSVGTEQDVVVVLTDHNVLAVLDPADGGIIWRQRLESEEIVVDLAVSYDTILTVSRTAAAAAAAATHDRIRAFSSQTGHLLWETVVPASTEGAAGTEVDRLGKVGTAVAFLDDKAQDGGDPGGGDGQGDFLVLTDGRRVQRLDRESGRVIWSWETEYAGSTLTLSQITTTRSAVHVIGLVSSFASRTLAYISLSPETGTPLPGTQEVTHIPHSDIDIDVDDPSPSPGQVVVLRDVRSTAGDSIAISWISKRTGNLVSTTILHTDDTTTTTSSPTHIKPRSAALGGAYDPTRGYTGVRDVGLSHRGYFLALLPDDGADLIKWTPGAGGEGARAGKLEATFHFEQHPDLATGTGSGTGSGTTSIWGGYAGARGEESWITRLFWSFSLQAAFKLSTHYPIIDKYSVVLTTSTGAIQLWQQDQCLWAREEGLSNIQETQFVELPEKKVEDVGGGGAGAVLHDEGLVPRLDLPRYLARFIQRFTSGSYTQALSSTPLTPHALYRDQFGFQKLVIVATSTGKLYALDSAHGNIVWSTLLALSMSRVGELAYVGMWNVRAVAEAGDPVITVVAVRSRRNSTETVAYHVDAFTGKILRDGSDDKPLMPGMGGKVLFQGRPLYTFPLPIEHCKSHIRAVAIIDTSEQVHFFPYCKKIASAFANMTSELYFATRQDQPTGQEDQPRNVVLGGYAFAAAETDVSPKVYPTWQLPLQPHEHISHHAIQQGGPIASYGRVLGDRTTLYKYLNPHLIAYSTFLDDGSNQASVNVLDSVSGSIVYQTLVENVDTQKGIPVVLAENWLVFTYTEKSPAGKGGSGSRLVSVELFEGVEDEKRQSLSTSGFAEDKVQAVSRSFIMPTGVKALTMTTSRYGITYKDLIYINDNDQVAFIPRRLLDPRRPDVLSSRDKEEMLIPYDPLLGIDPRRTLSHAYDIEGMEAVVTSPALLESTTLLFSYGLDLFGSRITPSGTFDILSDAFNKPQLLLTIAGLTAGIIFAKPAVERKLLTSRWF